MESPTPGDPGYDLHHIGPEWHALAQILAQVSYEPDHPCRHAEILTLQRDIQCHMILSPDPGLSPFIQLFHETVGATPHPPGHPLTKITNAVTPTTIRESSLVSHRWQLCLSPLRQAHQERLYLQRLVMIVVLPF